MRYLVLVLRSLLFTILISSCSSSGRLTQKNKHSLWEVQGKNNTVYLLGSIHVGNDDMYPLPSVIEKAFMRSQKLVVEVDVTKINKFQIMRKLVYPWGDGLKKHVDPQTYQDLMALADKYRLSEFTLSRFYPWVVSSTLDLILLKQAGYQPEKGIDYYFLNKNNSLRPVLELETIQFQLELFSSLDEQEQIIMLQKSIYSNQYSLDSMTSFVNAWTVGDTKAIAGFYEGTVMKDQPQFLDRILYQRNKTMSKKILAYLQDKGDYFVIVGLAHFSGKHSIIDYLEQAGYTVKQL